MGVFEMVVLITFIATVGKVVEAALTRPGRGDAAGAGDRVRALESELRANEARLAQTEERVTELDEKLRFVENLLAQPERRPVLPPPPGASPAVGTGGPAPPDGGG
jgi:hypothetical protein